MKTKTENHISPLISPFTSQTPYLGPSPEHREEVDTKYGEFE